MRLLVLFLCIAASAPAWADGVAPSPELPAPRMAQLKSRLGAIIHEYRDWARKLPTGKVPIAYGDLAETGRVVEALGATVEELSRRAASLTQGDEEGQIALDRALSDCEAEIAQARAQALPLELYALARKFAAKPAWSVALAGSALTVSPDPVLFRGRVCPTVELSAAPGAAAFTQIVIWPLTRDIQAATVSLPAALIGPRGARIPRAALQLHVAPRPEDREPSGLPVFPQPVNVDQGSLQAFGLSVSVPPDAPVGLYRGKLTLRAEKAHSVLLSLEIRVTGPDAASPNQSPDSQAE